MADENGIAGNHRNGCKIAVKKGRVAVGSGGKTSTFKAPEEAEEDTCGGNVKAKRAKCLGMFQFLRPFWVMARLSFLIHRSERIRAEKKAFTIVASISLAHIDASDTKVLLSRLRESELPG